MLTDTEGIVLRQTKTSYGRRMILLFSSKYGKISAGTSIGEKRKTRAALALRPFTYGRYELFKNRDSYNINGADVLNSHYKIGEDVDKYLNGAYVLEFTERVLPEEESSPGIFALLKDFLDLLETRDRGIGTLVLAYQVKLLKYSGVMPILDRCVVCGGKKPPAKLSVEDGGMICAECAESMENLRRDTLIYDVGFGIVDILEYFMTNPLKRLENIALKEDVGKLLQKIIREYAAYYLDVADLKSEKLI